jgi:hypothetical protein
VDLVESQQGNPLRKLSFYFGLAFLFSSFAVLPEFLYYVTGVNTYLIYLIAPAAILGGLISGGVRRTFRYHAAWYWLAFFLWMIIATPFSTWKGGSTTTLYAYARVSMSLLFVAGGLATTWKEIRTAFHVIAAAGALNLVTAGIFEKNEAGRITLDASGSIGNSNDLAAHLLLVLPFMLFVLIERKINPVIRYLMLPLIAYGLWTVLGTASRGALLALCAVFLFTLWRATPMQRVGALVLGVALAGAVFVLLPAATLNRLSSLTGQANLEADESADSRGYLFRTSMRYTLQHPLFGVGPGQFGIFEGNESHTEGRYGSWHETHCAWTQVSSENGVPALIFFVLGILSALAMVYRTFREARKQGFEEIANACFCYMAGMLGFLVAITFLANAYRFYLPAMVGLAISLRFVALQTMKARPATVDSFPGRIPLQPILAR